MNPTDTAVQASIEQKFAEVRALFPHTKSVTYFNSASYGPFPVTVKEAVERNIDMRVGATRDDSHDAFATADELRQDFAGLIGARKQEVGVGLNTQHGLNIAAFGLPLKEGDEVLVSDIEFPAAVYVWRAAAEARGVKLRFIPSRDRRFDIEEFKKAITPRTRVLTLAYVQFFNGYKNDLATISRICKEHDIFFVVDGIQGMGTQPLNVHELGIDIFTSGCQKWMLAPQGCGFFYLSDSIRDRLAFSSGTWLGVDWGVKFTDLFHYDKPWFDSAVRFEMGYYVVFNLLGMKAAVEIFKHLGIENIQRHNNALIDRLVEYLRSNPYYTITSSLEEKHRSSIFTFSAPEVPTLHRKILDQKIILVHREGSIRVSAHLFNNTDDIDRLISVLDDHSRNKA